MTRKLGMSCLWVVVFLVSTGAWAACQDQTCDWDYGTSVWYCKDLVDFECAATSAICINTHCEPEEPPPDPDPDPGPGPDPDPDPDPGPGPGDPTDPQELQPCYDNQPWTIGGGCWQPCFLCTVPNQ